MSKPEVDGLPASWAWATLDELGVWGGGGTPSKSRPEFWAGGKYPWVSSKDMKVFEIADTEDHITSEAIAESSTNLYPAGTVLVVTRSGILRHSLPVAVSSVPVTINQDLKAFSPHSGIDPKYVAYALRSAAQAILHDCVKDGTTVQSVEFAHLYQSNATVGARAWFKQALEEAKIAAFRWHDLRHTFASRLVMAGVSIHTVQQLMGHKTIQVTLRYAHLAPAHQLEAVQRLCDTGVAQSVATDTRTDTGSFGGLDASTARPN